MKRGRTPARIVRVQSLRPGRSSTCQLGYWSWIPLFRGRPRREDHGDGTRSTVRLRLRRSRLASLL